MNLFLSIFLFCSPLFLLGQSELNYPELLYPPQAIKANWVSHPDIQGGEDRIVLFRNEWMVDDPSEAFIINISADNHYFLYVNGNLVTHGPQLSDIRHWKYETIDLKTYLKTGKNLIAIKVVNYGKRRFYGMQSIFTSLMVNGATENAKVLNTSGTDDGWKCSIDDSYRALEVNWRGGGPKSIVGGFYANNPTDFVDKNHYPTDWEQADFDDSDWVDTQFFEGASSMGGSMAYLLEPRNLPLLTWEKEGIGHTVRTSDIDISEFPVSGKTVVPEHKKIRFLIDQKYVTNGFPELIFSKGKNAHIKIKYAENLFGPKNTKGDRNIIKGKELLGYYDHVVSNGKERQKFTPNWMRTFRFVEFEIETKGQELVLDSFSNYRSRTHIPSIARFSSNNETYNAIFDICKRTVDICTQDYFLSDAYYETMQYVGDTKIHALLWQAMSGNLAHTKNAIEQFHQSRDADGNILGAYPLRSTFIYPTYSLVWVDMVYDYYQLTNDTDFINTYKDGIIHTLAGFEKNMNELNLVNETQYRYFVDWYTGPNNGGGTATKNNGKNSAVVSLHYVHALQNAARLFKAIGDKHTADTYLDRATAIKSSVYKLCFDPNKNIFAERPDKTVYDQHTNIMAVLTDAIAESEQKALLSNILNDPKLLQATYYYRYYLFEAIKKVGAPELFDLAQRPWQAMIDNHMTTTLERFESDKKPTRSEVHPWSASPAYFYFNYLAGIKSVKNDFQEIEIAPVFGILEDMEGLLPTSKGNILFHLKKIRSKLSAEITVPKEMSGELVWNEKHIPLKHGQHTYILK
ncbi:hypothetical protein Q4603_07875 [Zobellia galactanivorans]|uniref:alpha-L-rhamnosidase-related protein n=1 Tax=Zobellia galactanivorans (strain DSM 12802 / CCUG 47099 / CIP 106680 / NCIMB 13871 / Dsij) TaxID=63186 RepID=UPI0026E2EBE0|nr:hypothetical protein [Zobellia galactanivorans]MDO6808523.1 hypothetical protein [Zobellia galactanivorans]